MATMVLKTSLASITESSLKIRAEAKMKGSRPSSSRSCPSCPSPRATLPRRMTRTALYTGSFDPVTNGHVDVVRHACRLADRLVVAIGVHPGKAPMFSAEERADMLREACGLVAAGEGVSLEVTTFDGLAVDAARRHG